MEKSICQANDGSKNFCRCGHVSVIGQDGKMARQQDSKHPPYPPRIRGGIEGGQGGKTAKWQVRF